MASDESDRAAKITQLARLRDLGEKAYDQMYEAHWSGSATAAYSDAKECFYDAIRLAGELGLAEDAAALRKRLEHIKAVFRSQFAG